MAHEMLLLPRAAPHGVLRVWLGVTNCVTEPQVEWRLNGQVVAPNVLSDPASAVNQQPAGQPRTFTGPFQFDRDIAPDTPYRVEARLVGGGAAPAVLETRTPPRELALGGNRWLNVLVVSCYYRHRDRSKRIGHVVPRLPAAEKPDLAFLVAIRSTWTCRSTPLGSEAQRGSSGSSRMTTSATGSRRRDTAAYSVRRQPFMSRMTTSIGTTIQSVFRGCPTPGRQRVATIGRKSHDASTKRFRPHSQEGWTRQWNSISHRSRSS